MIFKASILIISLLCLTHSVFSQAIPKKDLYLFFQENSERTIFKQTRSDTALYNRTTKLRSPAYNYDIYAYTNLIDKKGIKRVLAFSPQDKNQYFISDTTFVAFAAKKIDEIINISGIFFPVDDKRYFPFNRVYIVEYLSENKFKIIEVDTFIGQDFF